LIKNPCTLPKPPDNKSFSIKAMPKLTPYSLPHFHPYRITFNIPRSFRFFFQILFHSCILPFKIMIGFVNWGGESPVRSNCTKLYKITLHTAEITGGLHISPQGITATFVRLFRKVPDQLISVFSTAWKRISLNSTTAPDPPSFSKLLCYQTD
jgi:hypothetical protein